VPIPVARKARKRPLPLSAGTPHGPIETVLPVAAVDLKEYRDQCRRYANATGGRRHDAGR
jgi:hypothetical protein